MSLARKLAALTGKDDPLQAENDTLKADNASLTARIAELETAATAASGELAAVTQTVTEASAEIDRLKAENVTLKTEATAARAETERTKADATSRLDAKEKSVGQRANQAAIDQMAGVGQPPPDKTPAPGAESNNQTKPQDKTVDGFMSQEDALRCISRIRRAGSN